MDDALEEQDDFTYQKRFEETEDADESEKEEYERDFGESEE